MAAIGAVSGLLVLVTHEVLGHSLATIVLGAHVVRVTSVDSSYGGPASPTVMRLIAIAGITANLVVGWLVVCVGRSATARSPASRFFAWVFGHATLFMGSSYLAGFALLPFGDVHVAIAGLRFPVVYQALALVGGVAIYRWAFIDARRTFVRWTSGEQGSELREFTLVPYLAMGATATLASMFSREGAFAGALWAAAATFGANYGLLVAGNAEPRNRAAMPEERFEFGRNGAWIFAAILSTLVLFSFWGREFRDSEVSSREPFRWLTEACIDKHRCKA